MLLIRVRFSRRSPNEQSEGLFPRKLVNLMSLLQEQRSVVEALSPRFERGLFGMNGFERCVSCQHGRAMHRQRIRLLLQPVQIRQ